MVFSALMVDCLGGPVPQHFTFLNIDMSRWTLIYGLWLIVWATIVSIGSGSTSITSWIPAMLGAPITIMGVLCTVVPARRKVWMHIAILFGLVAFLGGLDFFRGLFMGGDAFANPAAGASKLMLLISGALYVFICVRSFIWARANPPV
jgi:hypothetical protein|tara:strand:+ start:606 stop:1049 length:444 start_codon:yes stop_codon:yes gene_type:complete